LSEAERLNVLESKLEDLEARLLVREDEQDIIKLQYLYGYLIDKCLYKETVELFTDDCEVRFFGGVFKGKAGARRLYIERFQAMFVKSNNGPIDGFLLDHPQLQNIISVDPSGLIASGRGRSMMQAGRHNDFGQDARQWWEGGLYENVYKKVDGKWRIHILNYMPHWHADFEKGWQHTKEEYSRFFTTAFPEDPTGPDELLEDVWLWPTHKLMPFHMEHPITGENIMAERLPEDLERDVALLEKRRAMLEK